MESRIHREVYVRFGGECLKTYIRNNARRWILSLLNSVDFEKGKLYHSYYGSYMRIRNESDRLCKVHHLSVIDEDIEKTIKAIKSRKFKNWYDWYEDKKGSSYKSRLQRTIDKNISSSSDWEAFLKRMTDDGYEIKRGKHIAFKHKHQKRFTRAKTIGDDYTEESIKKRIQKENVNVYEPIDSIVDTDNNAKVKESKAYSHWATKHNLETMSKSMLLLRKEGYKSITELDASIQSLSFKL